MADYKGGGGGGGPVAGGKTAATFVVSADPAEGDYTTIQAALDNLPAEGGFILVREGEYTLAATITVPNKPVLIRGCGQQSTIINIEGLGAPAFTLTGVEMPFGLENLTILGSGAGDHGVYVDDSAIVYVNISDVSFNVVDSILAQHADGFGFFRLSHCRTLDSVDLLDSGTANVFLELLDCNLTFTTTGNVTTPAVRAFVENGEFTLPDGTWTFGAGSIVSGSVFSNGEVVFSGSGINLTSCYFTSDVLFDGADTVTASGCTFAGNNFGLTVTDSTSCVVVGCLFISTVPVTETGTSDYNVFEGNSGYDLSSPSFVGAHTKVEGSLPGDLDLTSANAYAEVFIHRNPMGLVGVGTIKNVGANDVTVKETVIDKFGVTDSIETVVTAGNDYLLDPQTNFDTARPPYVSYRVEVKSTVTDDHSDTETRFASNGAVES